MTHVQHTLALIRKGLPLLVAGAVATASVLLPQTAQAQPGEFVDGKLQPLADGFPSRPITFINVDDAGSRDGVYARSLQEALREISPVEIIVSDEPAPSFGSFYTIRDVMTRDGGNEGYYPIIITIPGGTMDLLLEPITEETGLTVDDLNIVVSTERIPYVLIQKKDAPWGKTFAEMVKYGKDNPGKLKYISHQVGSGNDIAMEWIMRQVGLEVTKIPAPDNNAQAAAVGAGEGDFGLTQAPVALQHFQAGRVDATLVTGSTVPAPWDKDPNVVSGKAAGLPEAPFGIIEAFVVPKDVPKEHVDWLYKLIKAGAESEHHKQREKTVPGTTINVLGPEESNKLKMQILEYVDPVIRDLGMHIEDQ